MATDRGGANTDDAMARQPSDHNSTGNLSDTLEGLNLTHMSDSSGSLSPLSVGRSPLPPTSDPAANPSGAAAPHGASEALPGGLEHPLSQPRLGEGKPAALPPRPRAVLGKQDRTVSWGVVDPPTVARRDGEDAAEDLSLFSTGGDSRTRPPRPGGALRLSDLTANPLESEAEAYIQRTLDEIDPTKAEGASEAQQTILGHVPAEAGPEVFADVTGAATVPSSPGAGAATARPPLAPKPILKRAATAGVAARTHGRTKSTAEDLFQVTADLTGLNKQHGLSASGVFGSLRLGSDGDDADDALTDQDLLVKNAATLIKRHNAAAKESSDTGSSSDGNSDGGHEEHDKHTPKAVNPSAHDRWNALKNTVQVANTTKAVLDLKKKTDDPIGTPEKAAAGSGTDDASSAFGDSLRRTSSVGPGRGHPLRSTTTRRQRLKSRYKDFEDWLKVKRRSMYTYVKFMLFFLIVPAAGVAAILFYLAGNPPCGTSTQCKESRPTPAPVNGTESDLVQITKQIFEEASASWWILFVCCRQAVTLSLALATQAFVIEFLALRTKWAVKLVGPFVTLFVVQSKGWPFILFWWGVYDFVLLYGSSRWARHWLFWQDYVDLFNENNPSGNFTNAHEYKTLLIVALVLSVVVSIKRFWVGVWFGRKTFHRYAEELTAIMKKSLLIGQVASLARDKEQLGLDLDDLGLDMQRYDVQDEGKDDDASKASASTREVLKSSSQTAGPTGTTGGGGSLMQKANFSSLQKIRINELLGAWEEPDVASGKDNKAPIAAIIQFRQSLSYLNTAFPFSVAFGPVSNRKECVECTEAVYHRLIGQDKILNFDVIASLAIRRNGELDEDKLKALIKLFRPDRDGTLSLVDFAKSIDSVYKNLRLLRASVANSTKMDVSFERIFNILFYFIVACIVLSVIGIDPIVLFASISGFIIGFAFMIGSAAAKYFEGVLFIVARKPYDIGDRINVSNPMIDTPSSGSPGWIVKDVDLYQTTVVYASTNEVASYANSTLAGCRIINQARSPKASVTVNLKFPVDTPYKKIQVYKGAVEEFIKARPREWGAFVTFRASRVEVDFGFVEYIAIAEHRDSWQHVGVVNRSKADLTSFCLELSKKMNMRYRSPPMPIDLNVLAGGGAHASPLDTIAGRPVGSPTSAEFDERPAMNRSRSNTVETVDWQAVSAMFEIRSKK